jgi:integrase
VTLDSKTVSTLRLHRTSQARSRLAFGEVYRDQGLVFSREDGEPLHPEVVSKRFAALIAARGLRRIRFHDLRHTHVAVLAAEGVPVKVIGERMGHASAAFTLDQYAHVLPGAQESASESFARAIGG